MKVYLDNAATTMVRKEVVDAMIPAFTTYYGNPSSLHEYAREAEQLLDSARQLAQRIAVNPPQAVRMSKRLLREGQHMRLDSLLELSASMQALAHHTQDHAEAVAALLEKRPGTYTGS